MPDIDTNYIAAFLLAKESTRYRDKYTGAEFSWHEVKEMWRGWTAGPYALNEWMERFEKVETPKP